MLTPMKKMLARIGVAALLGSALASVALAADSGGQVDASGSVAAIATGASGAVSKVALPEAASQLATQVLDAITGGANPSVVSRGSDDRAAAPGRSGDAVEALISSAQQLLRAATAGTVGVRPGWGCGDTNHKHSGPPGRPNADPPPGCAR